jgi:hypothetical protein
MKNKIEDLRNHLFEAIERLQDDEKMKNPIALDKEVKRASSIAELAAVIVHSAKVEVEFMKATDKTDGTGFISEVKQLK